MQARVSYQIKQAANWTWIYFATEPEAQAVELLKAAFGAEVARRRAEKVKCHTALYTKFPQTDAEIAAILSDAPAPAPAPAPIIPPVIVPATTGSPAVAAKLRAKGDALQAQIDAKLNPATANQNYTARRARIIEGMREDGYRLQNFQAILYALADGHESGDCPDLLKKIDSKAAVEMILHSKYKYALQDGAAKLAKLGLDSAVKFDTAASLLNSLVDDQKERQRIAREKAERANKIRGLVGQIDGYFPTPQEIVDQVMALACISADDKVIEPSAGDGAIARSVRALGVEPDVCEVSYTLREHLMGQGFNLVGDDCLDLKGAAYSVAVMNPPFEKAQDADHVRHVFDNLLAPGGRLVAIVSEGLFFRDTKKEASFRGWLDNCGYSVELEAGAFAASGTGVKTRIVYAEKPRQKPHG